MPESQHGKNIGFDNPINAGKAPSSSESSLLRRYVLIGGGALVLLLAVWLVPGLFKGEKANNEDPISAATDSLQSPLNLLQTDAVSSLDLTKNTPLTTSNLKKEDPSENRSVGSTTSHSKSEIILPQMVSVKGGSFLMGSPETEEGRDDYECQHRVTVGAFAIGKYEVTQAEWRAVMGTNPSKLKNCDDCPVETVSWNDIQEFLKRLNKLHPGKNYRLPTEAEWEYAARGGHKMPKDPSMLSVYVGGNSIGEVAWYRDNSESKTHPVGRKRPNALGLYDMSGNIWEWCQDIYKPYPCDSKNSTSDVYRILRGGGWHCRDSQDCRVAKRSLNSPEGRYYGLGFRLAASAQ